MAHFFRRAFYKLVPKWLLEGEGELVLYSMGLLKDLYLQSVREGMTARFPSRAGPSALELIGQDRGIFRGRSEAQDHYVNRLRAWRFPRGHRVRGSAFALLEQVSEYWGGILAETHDVNQNFHSRAPDGIESVSYADGWDWDGDTASWSRWWLLLRPVPEVPTIKPWPAVLGAYGGSLVPGRGLTVGQQGVTPEDIKAMRRLLKPPAWKPAGTRTDYAVVSLEDRNASVPTPIDPAGQWGTIRGRVTTAPSVVRFWRLR